MEFVRKGRGKFHGGGFTIVRPSGRSMSRETLELIHEGHDYNFRFDGNRIWLLDGEREIGFADGAQTRWELSIGERGLTLDQRKHGLNHSAVIEAGGIVSEVGGGGFPLKVVEINQAAGLTHEEQAFVVAVALLGWRESDRAMMGAGASVNSGGG